MSIDAKPATRRGGHMAIDARPGEDAMSASEPTETTFAQDLGAFARYWLRDRRVQIALALVVVGLGVSLNWGWLVAVGVGPILLALAPCAVMCALGLCMMGRGQSSCAKGAGNEALRADQAANLRTEQSVLPPGSVPNLAPPRSDGEPATEPPPASAGEASIHPTRKGLLEETGKGG